MWSVKTRPKPGSTSLATRSFSGVGLDAGWMSNFMLMSLGLPLPMAALFWRRPTLFWAGWLGVVSGRTAASLVTAGFRGQHVFRGHAFAEGGSPVCFAEMPLDNRTVD